MSKEFAIIETGGKQYRVSKGDILSVEKIKGEFQVGDKIVFDNVLMTDNGSSSKIGTPYLSGLKVESELLEEGKSKKISVIRYKAKSRYFKRKGHRQPFMKVKITSIK